MLKKKYEKSLANYFLRRSILSSLNAVEIKARDAKGSHLLVEFAEIPWNNRPVGESWINTLFSLCQKWRSDARGRNSSSQGRREGMRRATLPMTSGSDRVLNIEIVRTEEMRRRKPTDRCDRAQQRIAMTPWRWPGQAPLTGGTVEFLTVQSANDVWRRRLGARGLL